MHSQDYIDLIRTWSEDESKVGLLLLFQSVSLLLSSNSGHSCRMPHALPTVNLFRDATGLQGHYEAGEGATFSPGGFHIACVAAGGRAGLAWPVATANGSSWQVAVACACSGSMG